MLTLAVLINRASEYLFMDYLGSVIARTGYLELNKTQCVISPAYWDIPLHLFGPVYKMF